ncbi:Phage integrase family protein [Actinacidiphila paucisporea]|uniref:Phage integrase family protein n=1 Tax=Actinacidiphila paucisporea TaxID=310782 RepID=A0A1M6XFR7_9ACTN|nr:Phage integrase family protein [Actinacidiphila paucisporea]
MVWTPELLGRYLDAAEGDRLYALFHLVAFRGPRRGEAVGQDWAGVALDRGELTVSKTIVHDGWGLPPISFRDLRHLAATLMHASGADTHTIKETLRHASIQLTSDTYTNLLPELDRQVAEKAARLVPRAADKAAPRTSGLTSGSHALTKEDLLPLAKPGLGADAQVNRHMHGPGLGGAAGTRTQDRRIMSPLL